MAKKKTLQKSKEETPKEKTAVGRKCSICTHEKVDDINAKIARSVSFRDISRQFFGNPNHKDSVARHVNNCLNIDMAALIVSSQTRQAVNHYDELYKQLLFAKELQEAAREILTDSVTGKVSLRPRADEVIVIYKDWDDINDETFQPKNKSAKLQKLLEKIRDESNYEPEVFSVKVSDVRNYAIKTIDAIDVLLDKFARVDNHYFKDKDSFDSELNKLKDAVMKRANQKGIGFYDELKIYLDKFGEEVHPHMRSVLNADLVANTPEISEMVN